MAYSFGNKTINDGLVFCLDAANPLSYTNETTFWKSIAKDTSIGYFTDGTYFDSNYYEKKAIRFDGNDDYIVGQSGPDRLLNINNTGTITIQVFFSITNLQSKKPIFCASADESTNAQYGIGISQASGDETIYAYIFDDSVDEAIDTNEKPDTGRAPYRLLTISFGASRAVYFDNIYITDHGITITGNPLGNYWFLGTRPSGAPMFDGAIHAVRVYNRALSALEISNNYQFYTQRN
jgi:hypothetical protein